MPGGRPRVWDKDADERLSELVNAGGNMPDLLKMFTGQSENNLRVQMSRLNLKFTEAPERVDEIVSRITRSDNLAHRLMVLSGEGKKPKREKIRLPDDETILSWRHDIKKFNLEVPVLHYCRLPGTEEWGLRTLMLQDYQMKMIDMWSNDKLSIVNSGHQVGKDLTLANYIIWKSVTVPGFFAEMVTPAIRQALELSTRIKTMISYSDLLYTSIVHDQCKKDEIIWTNGSRDLSLPALGTITGYTEVDFVAINEAGRPELPNSTIDDVRPMLAATGGNLALVGNPYFKTTPFYHAWKDPLYSKLEIWTKENVFLPGDFLEVEIQRLSPEEYARRYCAQFIDSEKAFIPSKYIDDAQEDYDYSLNTGQGREYCMGIDWGRKINESVIAIVSKYKSEYKLVWMEGFLDQELVRTEMRGIYLDKIFHCNKIIPEYNSLSFAPVDDMCSSVVGFKVEKLSIQVGSKWKVYENMMKLFLDKKIKIPLNETELSVQIRMLETKATTRMDKETGAPVYSVQVPRGENDDRSDALALALWGFKKQDVDSDWFTPRSY